MNLAEIDADRARELKLKEPSGVEITRVEDGSPADKAGLKPDDVVLEYNGQRVEGMEQFGRLVRETPAGRDVKMLISRNGATTNHHGDRGDAEAESAGRQRERNFRTGLRHAGDSHPGYAPILLDDA